MKKPRPWTKEEELILRDRWGETKISSIAKKLDRNYRSITEKAKKMGLLSTSAHFDGVTLFCIANTMGINHACNVIQRLWIDKLHIPYKSKVSAKQREYKYICLDDFWKWAKANQDYLDFSKMEKYALGKEPSWMKEKREHDIKNSNNSHKLWTEREIYKLRFYLIQQKYTCSQIAGFLGRSTKSIQRKIQYLNIKDRPVFESGRKDWNKEEEDILLCETRNGTSINVIASKLKRSENSIYSKIRRMLLNGEIVACKKIGYQRAIKENFLDE